MLNNLLERVYDDFTQLAAFICGTPMSMATFVEEDGNCSSAVHRSLYKSTRDRGLHAPTLSAAKTFVVDDATKDQRFAGDPLVTLAGVRFYAGITIVSSEALVLGTLSLTDTQPRTLSESQLRALEQLARQASSVLEDHASSHKAAQSKAAASAACEKAEQARDRLQLSLDAAGVATWFYDPARNIVGGDAQMRTFFGLNLHEGPAALWLSAVLEADRSRVAKEFEASLLGAPYDTSYRVEAGGCIRWLHARAKVTPRHDGTVLMVGICEDISREESLAADLVETEQRLTTERRLAAERLHLESERLQMSLATSNATSFEWISATDEVRWSGMAPFGVDPARIPTGASAIEYVHPDDRAGLSAGLTQALEDGQPYAYEYRALWSDGSVRWVRTAGRALKQAEGWTRFLGVNTDITERRLSEEALLQTEKLAAVGRMASVISHEINNPLEAVTNLLYIVRSSPSLTREDREHLELADRELARVSQITSQALRFHRNGSSVIVIDADIIVQELLSLYRTRLTASEIKVWLDLQEDVRFQAYEGEIRQVLNNLFGNAFDAMRKGGVLRIRTRFASDPKTGEKGVSITIADNGQGIPLEARGRVFEAFYSTKGINGTGLGLWISKRIVHKHKGRLTFRTSLGLRHGTAFRLWVPLEADPTAGEELG